MARRVAARHNGARVGGIPIDAADQRPTSFPWPRDAKIIEFGLRDSRLLSELLRSGYDRCVAVAKPSRRLQEAAATTALGERIVSFDSADRRQVSRNNANVLVLRGGWGWALWNWRNVRHAEWIALPVSANPESLAAVGFGALHWVLGRLASPQFIQKGAASSRLIVWRNPQPARVAARRYVPQRLGVGGFLQQLQHQGLRHAALRWFESLPKVDAGEDVDLLIEDGALAKVDAILSSGPGFQPVDLYTETGLPGTDFRSLPYYAPQLAEQLLERAIEHNGVCRVPNPRDHFLSLAYHALYHKGRSSGLPVDDKAAASAKSADHDYVATLARLAPAAFYEGSLTLNGLDEFLDAQGWRPSHDMLARLAPRNAWLRERLSQERDAAPDNGLIVFILRQVGMQRGGLQRAERLVAQHGFDIVQVTQLDADDAARAARSIRGGNWGKGPWPISGGLPAGFIVAHDRRPLKPTRKQLKKQPLIVNARSLCKDDIRDDFNAGVDASEHCNVIHSSDNAREALDYIKCLSPATSDVILQAVARIDGDGIVADFTKSGRRATIEVVRYGNGLAVRKTFKPHAREHFEREVQLLRELGGRVGCIPPLVDCGADWLMIPYYDDVLGYRRSSGRLLPVETAKAAVAALREVYEAGFAIVDASIDNLLVDRQEGLKLFDFEFSHRYATKPQRFEEAYDVVGCPADYAGPLPIQGSNSYEQNWKPYVGLSLESLLYDSPAQQAAKRALYVTLHAYRYLPRRARSIFRCAPERRLELQAFIGIEQSEDSGTLDHAHRVSTRRAA